MAESEGFVITRIYASEENYRRNLSPPGEGLIRTACGLFCPLRGFVATAPRSKRS